MGSSRIPSQNLDDFIRNFSYNGFTREDLDRKGTHSNSISSDFYETPKELRGLSIQGNQIQSSWRERFTQSDRNSYVNKFLEENDLIKIQGSRNYGETYLREKDLDSNSDYLTSLDDYSEHRPENFRYGDKRPISNQVSTDASGDELMLSLIDDLSTDVEADLRLNVYKRVDEAIELAEKLEDSKVTLETRKTATKELIKLFKFMDGVITNDINRLRTLRNAEKANRGENTGLQTSKEKDLIQEMSFRTTEKAQLNTKLGNMEADIVSLDVFNRL